MTMEERLTSRELEEAIGELEERLDTLQDYL